MNLGNGLRRVFALLALLALAACATPQDSAPVVDRTKAAPRTAAPAAAAQPGGESFYTVKRGDTLYSIALEHGVDYRELAQWNGLTDPTKISAGQQLRIKPPPERVAQQERN